MNYQITCVCGHRFYASPAQLGRHVPCPACHRALIPIAAVADPAAPSDPLPADPDAPLPATKSCPFCGETILAVARKCRFCNEYLDRTAASPRDDHTPPAFRLSVSQWDNFFRYTICLIVVLAAWLVLFKIPQLAPYVQGVRAAIWLGIAFMTGLAAWFFYLTARNARCIVRPTRIDTEVGIFGKQIDSLEMHRVVDVRLHQNLLERLLGIGTVTLKSSDATTPQLELYHIPKARKVYRYLLEHKPTVDPSRPVLLRSEM